MNDEKCFPYEDIVDLPHHNSTKRARMPRANRAAQFSPFAALTGHDSAIKETARLTDRRIELAEHEIAALDERLYRLGENIADRPEVTVIFFRPDGKKQGGAYVSATGRLKKIDSYGRRLIFEGGEAIAIDDIFGIKSDIFGDID